MSLEKKIIVVTGAASGIGAETVITLKEQGAIVIGVDVNLPQDVDRYIKADLADPASIVAAVRRFQGELMRCAILPACRRQKVGFQY